MSDPTPGGRAADLRRLFDRGFSLPPPDRAPDTEDLLAIHVGEHAYAVRLAEVSEVVGRRQTVAVPTQSSSAVGLTGIRGMVIPVFSLSALLGHADAPPSNPWLLVGKSSSPLAFAFSGFEGLLRVSRAALRPEQAGSPASRRHIAALAQTPLGPRPVVDLAQIISTLGRRGTP